MNNSFFGAVANLVAAIGVLACAATGLNRLLGNHHFLGYEAMTVFTGGVALMVFATLIKLQIIDSKLSGR